MRVVWFSKEPNCWKRYSPKKRPQWGPSTNSLGVGDPSHPALGLAETEDKNLCRVGEQR